MRPVHRIEPQGRPDQYKTYQISAPISTHFRPATCEEADCAQFLHGWTTKIDTSTELGRRQADYIDTDRTRTSIVERADTVLTYTFPAGQRCFAAGSHRVPLEREADFRIVAGDHRQYGRTVSLTPQTWLDDFAEHQQGIAELHQRG